MDYCRSQPGLVLLPLEHLTTTGCDPKLARWLEDDCNWSRERIALVDQALSLYWSRSSSLAEQTEFWPAPRLRNLGVVTDNQFLRPYAQVLNTSTSTLYECDLDPAISNADFVAYLFVLGDWMALTGEVTQAALRSAAWWFDAGEPGKLAFAQAAADSRRPDAAMLQSTALSLPWMEQLLHRDLSGELASSGGLPVPADDFREVPGTGLYVPKTIEKEPVGLVNDCRQAAKSAVDGFRQAWNRNDRGTVSGFCQWLEASRPTVVIDAAPGELLWDCREPGDADALATALEKADQVAVDAIREDIVLIDAHSRTFMAALQNPEELPHPNGDLAEGGYSYMHGQRRVICYSLFEKGMERLAGPPLPYARLMLGARTWHEWGHLADEAGAIDPGLHSDELAEDQRTLATCLSRIVAECDAPRAEAACANLEELTRGADIGEALSNILFSRLPDYHANLLARRFMSDAEAQTYARHNIRTLKREYPSTKLWSMLLRYLYEYQYLLPQLGLIRIDDPYRYFVQSTGFDSDVIAPGVVSEEAFLNASAALAKLCGRAQIRSGFFLGTRES
jgi:hypothetical protein